MSLLFEINMIKTHQRHKTYFIGFVASSVDGKISLTEKTLPNWTSKEDKNFLEQKLAKFDAVVVGRNTYCAAANRLRKRNTFVLSSRTEKIRKQGSVTFINPQKTDLKELLSKYKK